MMTTVGIARVDLGVLGSHLLVLCKAGTELLVEKLDDDYYKVVSDGTIVPANLLDFNMPEAINDN
jgi:hypothetical protein